MKKGLSIIIVNYYSEEYINTLVEFIISTIKLSDYELIIVNNSPSNFQWEEEFIKLNNIRILKYQNNDGFGKAINRGVEHSQYNYFCMLNPDILLESNTLDELYSYFNKIEDNSVGAVSCLIKNRDGSRQNSFFMDKQRNKKDFTLNFIKDFFPSSIRKYFFKEKIQNTANSLNFSEPFEVGGFYGSFIMLKKEYFKEVGGFDPDFFMYSEDTDFFRNRFSKKYKSYYYPHVGLTHFIGGTDSSGFMHKQAQVSFLLNLRKTGNYFLFIFVVILGLKYTLLLMHSLIKKRNDKKEAIDFFKNLKYLPKILKYPRGYHTLPTSLKIDEISKDRN